MDRLSNEVYFSYSSIPMPDAAKRPNGFSPVDVVVIGFDAASGA